jgi:histone arginine demethylase JMJD6
MKHFQKYLKNNKDDSPLYIFDSRFENDSVSKSLLEDYKVPSYFKEDLFSLVGEKRRPPYR